MTTIRIANFMAEFPLVHPAKLKEYAAAQASNVNLSEGTIKPFFKVRNDFTLPSLPDAVPIKSISQYWVGSGYSWLEFPDVVDLIYSPIKDDTYYRVYWSGDHRNGGKVKYAYLPTIISAPPYPASWLNLGIPAPNTAPIIDFSTPYVDQTTYSQARVYVFTYVNDIGEESAPSRPSAQVIVPYDAAEVKLSNLVVGAEATGLNITKLNIYRSAVNTNGTAVFRYVTTILTTVTTLDDNFTDVQLGEDLPTTNWNTPRNDMQGLGLTAYGLGYGFSGKIVCLSVPFYIYAWPRDYELTTAYDIVAIGHYESNIVVATRGNPVIITGIDPISGMSMLELPLNEACVSKRSMVSLGHSAIYASPNGLVMASAGGAVIVSSGFFGRDEWQALNPSTIHAVEHSGKYLFFWKVDDEKKGAYIFDPLNIAQGIVSLDVYCDMAYLDRRTDTLYMLQEGGKVQRFDVDTLTGRQPYKWRSQLFKTESSVGERFLAAKIIADDYDDLIFNVYCDGKLLYSSNTVTSKPFRMPNHTSKVWWQLEVIGTSVIQELKIAETMREIMAS